MNSLAKALSIRMNELSTLVTKAWSDKAREAALEARKQAAAHRVAAETHSFRAQSGQGSSQANIAAARAHLVAAQQFEAAGRAYPDDWEGAKTIETRAKFASARAYAMSEGKEVA